MDCLSSAQRRSHRLQSG